MLVIVATPECPGQSAAKALTCRFGFGCWLGWVLVLPQPLTSRDQFSLFHKAYTRFFSSFCFKGSFKLSCCCNFLDGATIRTSYNNRISYCSKHVTHPLLREEFIYNNNLLPQQWERITCVSHDDVCRATEAIRERMEYRETQLLTKQWESRNWRREERKKERKHAHASKNSKSYCSDCCTIQNVATMCSC